MSEKVSVTWSLKWPGPVDFAMLNPTITIERSVKEGETFEQAVADAHGLAVQSVIEALMDGLVRLEKALEDAKNK